MNYQAGFKIETKVVGVTFDNRQDIFRSGKLGHRFNVRYYQQRVGWGFDINDPGIVADGSLNFL